MFYYTRFYVLLECHGWSAEPISIWLHRWPRGLFCSECCTGGEPVAASRMNHLRHVFIHRDQAHWTGRKSRFRSLIYI